jgi:hypothetical protein
MVRRWGGGSAQKSLAETASVKLAKAVKTRYQTPRIESCAGSSSGVFVISGVLFKLFDADGEKS